MPWRAMTRGAVGGKLLDDPGRGTEGGLGIYNDSFCIYVV